MQYLLTETEYLKLKSEKAVRVGKERDELQAFCTLAANHIPVKPHWSSEPPSPWGCILGGQQFSVRPEYCDCCPSQKLCPYDGKEWSK